MAEPDIAIDIIHPSASISALSRDPGRADPGKSDSGKSNSGRPRLAARTLGLVGLDAGVTVLSAIVCYAAFNSLQDFKNPSVLLPIVLLTLSVNLNFMERGLYTGPVVAGSQLNGRRTLLAWIQAIAIGTLVAFCGAALAASLGLPPAVAEMIRTLRGGWLPLFLFVGFAALISARSARIRLLTVPAPLNRTVIIGDAPSVRDLVLRLRTGQNRVFDLVGIVEHLPERTDGKAASSAFMGLPVMGDIDVLERRIRQDAVDTVLVALPWSAGEDARQIIHRISMAPVDVYVYPGLHTLQLPLRKVNKTFDLPLLMVCNRPIDGWRAAIKRAEDIVLSGSLLLAFSPLMLAIALAIKVTSKGPVFFRQRRLGYNNRVIEVLKFRSMYTHLSDADAKQQALRGDKRVTRIGAWLRRTSLDELPQFINVLKGDMSLVGPRPHALATTAGGLALEEAVPVYAARHRVKPGITGWAQVNGHRGALDTVDKIVHRVNHDLYYIENWSLGLDLKILFQTVRLVFADDNAF